MAAKFTEFHDADENDDTNKSVIVTKSAANTNLIAEMMAQQFGYSPRSSLDRMANITKSAANSHAIDHGNTFELHQLDGGTYLISPIGYGSTGDLALPVPHEYASIFETEISKAKMRADLTQRQEMRKSLSEVDSRFYYRKEMDLLLNKTYRLAKSMGGGEEFFARAGDQDDDHPADSSICPKCGGAMHDGQCSKCGFQKSPVDGEPAWTDTPEGVARMKQQVADTKARWRAQGAVRAQFASDKRTRRC
jgi:hypothetical protein